MRNIGFIVLLLCVCSWADRVRIHGQTSREAAEKTNATWLYQEAGVQWAPNTEFQFGIIGSYEDRDWGTGWQTRLDAEHTFEPILVGLWGSTAQGDFLPNYGLGTTLSIPLSNGWVPQVQASSRFWEDGPEWTIMGGAERYLGPVRLQCMVGLSEGTLGNQNVPIRLAASWYLPRDWQLDLLALRGEEAEIIRDKVVRMETRSLATWLTLPLNFLQLRVGSAITEQETLGLRTKFFIDAALSFGTR